MENIITNREGQHYPITAYYVMVNYSNITVTQYITLHSDFTVRKTSGELFECIDLLKVICMYKI